MASVMWSVRDHCRMRRAAATKIMTLILKGRRGLNMLLNHRKKCTDRDCAEIISVKDDPYVTLY